MKCIVTGMETKTKWRNVPVSKDALEGAKKLIEDNPDYSMREALRALRKAFLPELKKELEIQAFAKSLK